MSAWSCDQLCPITVDHISATCQCPSVPALSAHPCHISATFQCPSELPFCVTHQCQSVPPISAASQCRLSVCISASQCRLSV
ncbi:unnamed protein product, partial [Staurois parvus]